MSDYQKELKVAKRAAGAAAELIRGFHSDNSFTVNFKGKNDLVTDADVAAENKIISIIEEVFPDDQILAEETASDRISLQNRTWLIDPIDGTTNFAHGFPVYCVSIAMWEEESPKVGLVLQVPMEECFTAVAGEGAWLNGNDIQISDLQDQQNALIVTGFPYTDLSLVDNYLEFFRMLMHNTQGIRRPGAASYDLCCVACGRFDGFYEYSLSAWDVAAASLIIKEAGGTVTDWEGGDNWLFGERIVAGNETVHKFLLEGIREHFRSDELRLESRV